MDMYEPPFFQGVEPESSYYEEPILPGTYQNPADVYRVQGVPYAPNVQTFYMNGQRYVCSFGRVSHCNEN